MSDTNRASGKVRNLGITMAVYLFGIFMGAIDTGIVTPARTVIQNNLAIDEKTGIWMITIYTLFYAASIPVMGKMADKYGRKYIYITSIFLFALGSLFCGLAQDFASFPLLLVARSVQAIGGGGIMPVATAEFGTTFPIEKRGMALGLIGGVYGIANIFGASAGSAILDIFGKNNWQFIFYINLPISLFVIVAGLVFLPNTKITNVKKIDVPGILLIVIMVFSIMYGLRNIDFFDLEKSFFSIAVFPYLAVFLILLPIFILTEKKAQDPVMNLGYFTNFKIVITLIISFIVGIIMMGMVFVPQFSENAVKIASGSGGYFVIILGLFAGVGAPFSGRLIDRYSAKFTLMLGFIISIIGALFLIVEAIPHPSMITVSVSLILIGLGMGFTIGAPLNYMMLENTNKEESNSALATLSLVRSIGTAIAPAIMIGFLAHAGFGMQDQIRALLPTEVNVPALPYAQELTQKISKMKNDPNMKDKLNGVDLPDLSAMTAVKIETEGNSSFKISDNLLELIKTADVTNIVQRTKLLAAGMFNEKSPQLVTDIQSGVQKGVDSLNSGLPDMQKNLSDMKNAYDGMGTGITKMSKGADGMADAIKGMKQGVLQQETALEQMRLLYGKMIQMPGAGGKPTGDGMPTGAPKTVTGGMAMSGQPSLVDMIPQQVREKIPKSVLDQLKDVKTPSEFKAKITALENAITTLRSKALDLEKQRGALQKNIEEARIKQNNMKEAIIKVTAAEADMKDTLTKMSALKEAIPEAFSKARDNYLAEIDHRAGRIQGMFQDTLNNGFRQVYLTTVIAAAIAMLFLLLYRKKRSGSQSIPNA